MDFRNRATPSTAPGGYGNISHGYRRIQIDYAQRREHHLVWEYHNGPIPEGMIVHHINEDKLDNRIDNLELVDFLTHKRIHSGCFINDEGIWIKPCRKCGVEKPISEYHKLGGNRNGVQCWCKSCLNQRNLDNYYKRLSNVHGGDA